MVRQKRTINSFEQTRQFWNRRVQNVQLVHNCSIQNAWKPNTSQIAGCKMYSWFIIAAYKMYEMFKFPRYYLLLYCWCTPMLISHWEINNIYCICHILTKTPIPLKKYEYHIDIGKNWQGGGAMKECCVTTSQHGPWHINKDGQGRLLAPVSKRQFPMRNSTI